MRYEPDVITSAAVGSASGRVSGRSDAGATPLPPVSDGVSPVLVVDDPDCGELVSRALGRHAAGVTVTQVRDGQSCLDMLDRQPYAVVLLDYGLPRMNGLEVLRRIREAGLAVPVVMATGQGDERVAVEAMKLGAADYVVKHRRYFATLPSVLAKALRQHALAAENARLSEAAIRQQRQLAQIFHSTSDGIVLVGESGQVLRGNRRAGELLDIDFEQAVDRPLADLLDGTSSNPADADGIHALLALLDAPGEGAHGELDLVRSGRALRWSGEPVRDGDRLIGLTLTFQDVTREREVSRMKSDFVSFVAHQLRTPLSGIKWMLELAGEEHDVPPMVTSCVRDASASADRLIGMVNDLLDIVLAKEQSLADLEDLGLVHDDLEIVLRNVLRPFGMVLVTGPTGSGKSTTLYAMLTRIGAERQNVVSISTIEDPIEHTFPRITQTQVSAMSGVEFATGLRALLRQDPDVVMIGEIRDRDTVEIAVRAALVGRLLLSTLHTNDATGTVPRLLDMGIEPFLVASMLALAIGQRLIRRICTDCRESVPAEDLLVRTLGRRPDFEALVQVPQRAGVLGSGDNPFAGVRVFRGRGCVHCGGRGFRGRVGVFELFEVTDAVRAMIMDRADAASIRKCVIASGMKTMFEDGMAKVLLGETTLEEVFRVAV